MCGTSRRVQCYWPRPAAPCVAIVLGNADPLCSLPMLYDFLKTTPGNISVDVVGGDHSWNVSAGTDPESLRRNADNIAQGVQVAAHWIHLFLGN